MDVLHKRAWWQAVVVSQNRRNATVLIFATGAKRTSTAADMRRTLVWEKERFQALEGQSSCHRRCQGANLLMHIRGLI